MPVYRFETSARLPNEPQRLAALAAWAGEGDAPDPLLDTIVARAAALCETPMALVSIVQDDIQQFRARIGIDATQTSRSVSFCGHALLDDQPLVIADATLDARFAGNPLVIGPPHIRAYAGVPLITATGLALGTLCVIDTRPRAITAVQLEGLALLAAEAVARLCATAAR